MVTGYEQQAQIFKALAHPFRVCLLYLLSPDGACICHLVEATKRPQPYISQHMSVLRGAGLVVDERRGRYVHYYLRNARLIDAIERMVAAAGHSTRFAILDSRGRSTSSDHERRQQAPMECHMLREPEWYPVLLAERCTGCGVCVTACEHQVMAFDYALSRPVLREGAACFLGCATCAALCPQDALRFPAHEELHRLMRRRGILRWAQDELAAHQEKYGTGSRDPTDAQSAGVER